jgi:hypothetical protein
MTSPRNVVTNVTIANIAQLFTTKPSTALAQISSMVSYFSEE